VQLLGFRAINRVCEVCFDPADPASAPSGFFSIGRGDRKAPTKKKGRSPNHGDPHR